MMTAWSPCSYRRHREFDWLPKDGSGPIACGICHPPVSDAIVRRSKPGWNAAVLRREKLIAAEAKRLRDPFNVLADEDDAPLLASGVVDEAGAA